MINRTTCVICLALGLSATAITSAQAEVAASFSLPQTPFSGNLVSGVDGFDFTPTRNITVTALGWYDQGADGLNNPHPVGIYQTSSQQLVAPSATVTSASPLDVETSFRFQTVTPIQLLAGVTYTVVGFGSGPSWDPYVTNPIGGVTFNPSIEYERWRTAAASGLQFPTIAGENGVTQQLFFAANFQIAPIPEPASFLLFPLGLGFIGFARRKLQCAATSQN